MRGRELWCATCVIIAVHGALLYWAWRKTSPKLATTSVLYVQVEPMPQTRVEEATTAVSRRPRQVQSAVPAPANSAAASTVPKPQTAYLSPEPSDALPKPIGYLPVEAVDQEAEPLGDWVINTDTLPPGRVLRVMLKLWISSTGVIDQWELSGVEGDEQALAQRALADVSKTVFQPAFLNTTPVPNFRQLELVLTH